MSVTGIDPETEPAFLIQDFIEILGLRGWQDNMADDFLDWISADRDRADLWHWLKDFHSLDNDELIAYAIGNSANEREPVS